MKRRNKGKNKVLYVLIALAAVIAAGFIGVRFGLSQGSIRRARMADEASKPESASSGMISAESGKDDGNSDGTSSGEAGTSSDEAVSQAESAETDPEEEERTHSMLAEMSEAAIKEDEITVLAVNHLCDHTCRHFVFRPFDHQMIALRQHTCRKCKCRIILEGIARSVKEVCMKHLTGCQGGIQKLSRRGLQQKTGDAVAPPSCFAVLIRLLFFQLDRFFFLRGQFCLSLHQESP